MQRRRGKKGKRGKKDKKTKKRGKKKASVEGEDEDKPEGENDLAPEQTEGNDGDDTQVQDKKQKHDLNDDAASDEDEDVADNNFWTSPLMAHSMIYAQSICNIVARQADIKHQEQELEKEDSPSSTPDIDLAESKFGSSPLMGLSNIYARAAQNFFERQEAANREAEDDGTILPYPKKPANSECFASSPLLFHSAVYARSIHNIVAEMAGSGSD